jgi:ssDNA-binding Zn-finger/Zn-ribbon topoisomerase 1
MGAIQRTGTERACPSCGRTNLVILPEGCYGSEFVWNARCGSCGEWRWFHAREDASFVLAVKETARRRDEMGGLSPEGTRQAHAAFEATLDPCSCGGRFHVVRDVLDEPCVGCGRPFRDAPAGQSPGRAVDVKALRPGE